MKEKFLYVVCITFFCGQVIAQNVGIGVSTPAAPLHLKSATSPEMLRVEGPTPYISLYNGATYKGYVWYDGARMVLGTATNEPVVISAFYSFSPAYFTPTGRLGLGISNPAEVLDVAGNINLNGVIKVNGSSGTAGQVLTSNGAADPQWKNTAYGNTTRFSVHFGTNLSSSSGISPITSTNYNLNPADVSIGASSITINHGGLYHLDFLVSAYTTFDAGVSFFPRFNWDLHIGANTYALVNDKIMDHSNTFNTTFYFNGNGSLEIYIPAGTILTLQHSFSGTGSAYSAGGQLIGNLISD
jgi:hypothetical protein